MGQGLGGAKAYEVQVSSLISFQFPLMSVRNPGSQYGTCISGPHSWD